MAAPIDRFFHPVLHGDELRRAPVGVAVDDRRYVLFRGADGRAAAFVDECPHRGAPLSRGRVEDGRVVCPYHGWRFAPDGQGACPTDARADCRAAPLAVVERHGAIWLGGPRADPATIPAFDDDDGFSYVGCVARTARAPLPLVVDNFAENEHVPWVHTRLGWSARRAGDVEHACETHDDRTEVRYVGPQRASWIAPLLLVLPGDRFENRWVHRFDPPRATYVLRWSSRSGAPRPVSLKTAIWFVPTTAKTTRVQVFVFTRVDVPGGERLLPIVGRIALRMGAREIDDDAKLLAMMADAPLSLAGRSLGRYDRAVVHNRRLLSRIYRGEGVEA